MLLKYFYDQELAQASYLVGSPDTGEALVIDPARHVEPYLQAARQEGLRITQVTETHIHADFVSGSRELAARTGARLYLSGMGGEDWSYAFADDNTVLLRDGDHWLLGEIRIDALHTPGHTPEHLIFQITDAGAKTPMALFTGDCLFVGDVGRPDLLETALGSLNTSEAGARQQFRNVQRFKTMPDHLQVLPGHGAGSACGKALGAVPQTTVGYEKRFNPAIRLAGDRDAFLDYVLRGQPEPPMYFARMKTLNRDGAPVLKALPHPRALTPRDLETLPRETVVLDTRPWRIFREAHLPGSLFTPFDSSFPTIPGCYVQAEDRIILLIDEAMLEEAVRLLIRIGLDRIEGFIAPEVFEEYRRAAGRVESIEEVNVAAVSDRINRGEANVLDVRRLVEHQEGHVAGSTNIAHTRLMARVKELEPGADLIVHCRSGVRSSYACAYLKRLGFTPTNLAGGFLAWERAGQPVETAPRVASA